MFFDENDEIKILQFYSTRRRHHRVFHPIIRDR